MALDDVKGLIIGSILFVMMIGGGVIFLGMFGSSNVSSEDASQIKYFNSTINKATDVTSSVNQIKTSIDVIGSGGSGIFGWLSAIYGSIYYSLKATFQSLGFMSTLMADSVTFFGFDIVTPIIGLVGLIIIVIIAFAIWSAITRSY